MSRCQMWSRRTPDSPLPQTLSGTSSVQHSLFSVSINISIFLALTTFFLCYLYFMKQSNEVSSPSFFETLLLLVSLLNFFLLLLLLLNQSDAACASGRVGLRGTVALSEGCFRSSRFIQLANGGKKKPTSVRFACFLTARICVGSSFISGGRIVMCF